MINRARAEQAADLIHKGQRQQAGRIVSDLLREDPASADAWALRSELELTSGNFEAPVTAIERALALAPGDVQRHIQLVRCLALANRLAEARGAVDKALALGVERSSYLTLLGSVLVRCEAYEEALILYGRALAKDRNFFEATRGLITVYRFLGRLAEAEALCDELLRQCPDDIEMVHLRSALRTQTASRNHVAELRARLATAVPDWRARVQLHYSLAKELEDVGAYQDSFVELKRGADLRHSHTIYDVQRDTEIFAAIKRAFTPERIADHAGQGSANAEPIFIVGMPRSGTTLVERIIASHDQVFAAGELNDFSSELMAHVARAHGDVSSRRLELPELAFSIDLAELGESYIAATRRQTGNTPRFTDKLPLNFLYVGYIRFALPNARIVHVRREAMDSCYAMYKYLFKHAYPFSYDLENLGRYYLAYRDLMQFWHAAFPGEIHEIEYESLIADQEGESRVLLAALGLDWQDDCLNFHRSPTAATTGSAVQVRQPIYGTSVAKWRQYERELEPLRRILADGGAAA